MWCPDDIGRDSLDWVGPPAWGRACFNSPGWGGGSSPVKNGASPDCIIVVVCCVLCVVCCVLWVVGCGLWVVGCGLWVVVLLCCCVVVLLCCCVVVLLCCCCYALLLLCVVVEWLYYSKRIIIVRWADLSDFFRSFSSVKCVFLFHVQ